MHTSNTTENNESQSYEHVDMIVDENGDGDLDNKSVRTPEDAKSSDNDGNDAKAVEQKNHLSTKQCCSYLSEVQVEISRNSAVVKMQNCLKVTYILMVLLRARSHQECMGKQVESFSRMIFPK